MKLVRLIWSAYNIIFSLPDLIRAGFQREQIGIEDICDKYKVIGPEKIITYAKYYASSHSDGGPDLEYLINENPKNPNRLLAKTIENILTDSDKIVYLDWLIERIPKTPTLYYLDDFVDSVYFREFYSSANTLLDFYKMGIRENEDEKLIRRFADIFSYKTTDFTKSFIEKYIRCYHNTHGISKSRRSTTKKMLSEELDDDSERKQLEKIADGTLKNWEDQWVEFYNENHEPRTVNT